MGHSPKNDLSLKELILILKSYISEIFKSWKLLCLLGFGSAILLFLLNMNIQPIYRADLSYMLNEDERGGLGGMAALLGQFGLQGGSESNFDKILELSKTRRISQKALFKKAKLDGENDYLANHFIESLEDIEIWNKKGILGFLKGPDSLDLESFRFTHDSISNFSLLENKALKALHVIMVGKEKQGNYFKSSFSEITGIMEFSMESPEPSLSIEIVNSMFENLSDFYVEKAIEKQKYDFDIINEKYDSINTALSNTQYQLARVKDSSQGFFREQDLLMEKKLRQDEVRLQLMLGEAEKQKQFAELTLENETPYIQAIDKPILPLKPVNKSSFYYFLLGGLLGGILALSIIFCRKLYRDIMY